MVIDQTVPKRRIFLLFVLLTFLSLTSSIVLAQSSETGTYGASFLQIPVAPRLLTSTDVVAGINPDASLVFSNPAAMSGIGSRQIFITTANWLEDMQLSAASVVLPILHTDMRLGFSTRLLYSGGLNGYDDALTKVSEESYYDLGFTTSISRDFKNIGLSVGAGFTYVREHLLPTDGNGYSFSFGATYRRQQHSFHLFANDLAGKISFDGYKYPIDSRFVIGYGRSLALQQGQLNVGAQLAFHRADNKQIQFGGEYQFNRFLSLRTALNQYWGSPTNSSFPVSGGMGFHFWNATIDYAYSPHSYFPATHMFSFTYTFGQPGYPGEPNIDLPFNTAPEFPSSPSMKKDIKESIPLPSVQEVKKTVTKKIEESKKIIEPKTEPVLKPAAKVVPKPVPVKIEPPVKKTEFLLVAGTHGRLASAQAESHTLGLLKIKSTTEAIGNNKYRVLIGRYNSLKKAQKAANSFSKKGYRFEIVEE